MEFSIGCFNARRRAARKGVDPFHQRLGGCHKAVPQVAVQSIHIGFSRSELGLDQRADFGSKGYGPPAADTSDVHRLDPEAIVVARAVEEVETTERFLGTEVRFEVIEVIAGEGLAVGGTIRSPGSTERYHGRSKADDFSGARLGAYIGGCTAYDYALAKRYLLFLGRYKGAWHVAGPPFTRVNEEVDAGSDPWVDAVRHYARIAALASRAARTEALRALIERGRARDADHAAVALAADVERHFAHPSPHKSFAELEPLYEAASGRAKGQALIAIGVGADPAARAFMRARTAELCDGEGAVDADTAVLAIGKYYEKVVDEGAIEPLGRIYIAMGSAQKGWRRPLTWALIYGAGPAHTELMNDVFESADDEDAGGLSEWIGRYPTRRGLTLLWARVGDDHRDRYEMTMALAAGGDSRVVAWALERLKKRSSEDRWVAVYVIGHSPRDEADAAAAQIIAGGGEDLVWLLEAYGTARHVSVVRRLEQIGRRQHLSEKARHRLECARREHGATP